MRPSQKRPIQSPNRKQGSNHQFWASFAELLVIFLEIIENHAAKWVPL